MQDLWAHWQVGFMDPDRIPVALIAILMTVLAGLVSGPLAGNANPLLWLLVDKIFGPFGERLNRAHRPRADLIFRGFILTAAALFAALLLGRFYQELALEHRLYGLTEALLLSTLLTTGGAWYALLRLYFALEKNEVGKGAYYAISRSTRTNLTAGDDLAITRIAMSFAARVFDKGLVSPLLWYLIGGLPVAVAYSVLAALSWRFGKDGFTKGFGESPAALERLAGFIPSLYAGILVALAGLFTPTAKLHKGVASFFGMKNRAPYEQGGHPLSAMAWCLNVSLGGPRQDLSGSAIKGVWTGPQGASARNDHKHLRRALFISIMAHILLLASLCGAYLWADAL
jgi:adenosylcobinamide-phosphate synthase